MAIRTNKYTQSLCPVCKEQFKDDDEIVVCPICGAPYHKNCYKKENKCIFEETLHMENKDYQLEYPENKKDIEDSEQFSDKSKCPRCGAKNPPNSIFCNICGTPLDTKFAKNAAENNPQNPYGQMPFSPYGSPFAGVDPEEDLSGEKAKDIAGFVKTNTQYYLPTFKLMSQKKIKTRLSFSALLFPSVYFLYRKVWPMAIISLLVGLFGKSISFIEFFYYLINGVSAFPQTGSFVMVYYAISLITFGFNIFCGICANKIYFNHILKKLKIFKQKTKTHEDYYSLINKKGGASIKYPLIVYGTVFLIMFIIIYSIIALNPNTINNYINFLNGNL